MPPLPRRSATDNSPRQKGINTKGQLTAWLQTVRPANVLTSVADGCAGWAVLSTLMPAEVLNWAHLPFLLLMHALLYAGGIMMNDVFDAELDRRQRPERPIPKGLLQLSMVQYVAVGFQATSVGIGLLMDLSYGLWSLLIITATYLYNGGAKNHPILGPAAMGLCRSLNFLLPLAISVEYLSYAIPIGVLPLAYIAGITLSSRYEVEGGSKRPQLAAIVLYIGVIAALTDLALQQHKPYIAIAFIIGFIVWLMPMAFKAWQDPQPMTIRGAVRAGVLGLLWYDAAICAIYQQWIMGLIVVALLPICIRLGKKYSVT
jgi:4-hydroxybenzoate polyprenyltransferase